ncbi:type II toxin-antitoxin system VapC family toxin [Pedobacter sp. Leaf132]|uniref:type II toxin-antitoxin system VapC family toxin n=1 Tax=Pedobacter sp. Leaf132 TaxID=2876557 RepID=UPI002104B219|nr:type II toxin-antitoxin system VapC family toxin [Pedobacter sp. Leaf132]
MRAVENKENKIFISVASIWEIIVKINIGKLIVTRSIQEMYDVITSFGITILNFQKSDFDKYLTLPLIHKDPFDRMIISQALANDLTLITDDQHIKNYPSLKLF